MPATSAICFLAARRRPRRSPLFPYTTLFRSEGVGHAHRERAGVALIAVGAGVAQHDSHGVAALERLRFPHDTVGVRSEEHTSELQSPDHLVCRLLLEKKNTNHRPIGCARGRS